MNKILYDAYFKLSLSIMSKLFLILFVVFYVLNENNDSSICFLF